MKRFNTERLILEPLNLREHDLDLSVVVPLKNGTFTNVSIDRTAEKIIEARARGSAVIFMMGAHVLRDGVQRYLIDMLEQGFLSCVAMNGAGVIHDFEFALIGATTESVAKYIQDGRFGLWEETGRINDIVNRAVPEGLGFGEAIGREILEGDYPNKDISLLAQAYKHNIPVTVHVSIGYDIIHEHPNFDGAATGMASYRDFLAFAEIVRHLENGVVMNFGSAVMAPEVFLKALSMARNLARQENQSIGNFTTLVCDLKDLPEDYSTEAAKNDCRLLFQTMENHDCPHLARRRLRAICEGEACPDRGSLVDSLKPWRLALAPMARKYSQLQQKTL